MFETIVALATAPMRSALAIIRLSGEDCFKVVSKFFSKNLIDIKTNGIHHGFILEKNEVIDEVILLTYVNPHSFTGEDSVEIISHGSPLIFNKIIELAISNGARMAERGEFSSRAYMHGKMDLIQAESINDLINAESEESKKLSMMALKGETSKLVLPLKKTLGDILSLIEVNVNYPEYTDIEIATNEKVITVCDDLISYINKLIKDGKKGRIIKDGLKVAIVGKPNVGKSSILNALLGEEKAIVTDIKGTTRDIVEGKFNLDGVIINLYDTAGIRESNDAIETKGIVKSEKMLNDADICIAVFDSTTFDNEDKKIQELTKNKKTIVVYNKFDLVENTNKHDGLLYISALNNNVEPLKDAIRRYIGLSKENYENPSIANTREIGLLENIKKSLEKAQLDAKNGVPVDLINVYIQDAYLKVLALTGEDHDYDIATEIFSRFCLGK